MVERFSAKALSASLALLLALGACGPQNSTGPASSAGSVEVSQSERPETRAEAELARRSQAMQRTLAEATGLGATLGGGIGGSFGIRGLVSGVMSGVAAALPAATYVDAVQQKYATEEARLERVAADLEQSNAEAEAVLVAMQTVLDEQTAELADIRARLDADRTAASSLESELAALRKNRTTMRTAIEAADRRRSELGETRGVLLISQSSQEVVDPELAALGRRIEAMRQIADTLTEGT